MELNCSDLAYVDCYRIFNVHFEGLDNILALLVWFLLISFSKIILTYLKDHHVPFFESFPESCLQIIIGLFVGICVNVSKNTIADKILEINNDYFTNHNFFFLLLPPIIFEAGYTMPRKAFLVNLPEILSYAVIGTLINREVL